MIWELRGVEVFFLECDIGRYLEGPCGCGTEIGSFVGVEEHKIIVIEFKTRGIAKLEIDIL